MRKRSGKRGKEKGDSLQLVIAKRFVNIVLEIYVYPRVSASGIFRVGLDLAE